MEDNFRFTPKLRASAIYKLLQEGSMSSQLNTRNYHMLLDKFCDLAYVTATMICETPDREFLKMKNYGMKSLPNLRETFPYSGVYSAHGYDHVASLSALFPMENFS